jgi:hypothetical protein
VYVCVVFVLHTVFKKIYSPHNFTNDWFRHNMDTVTLLIIDVMETEMWLAFTTLAC